MSTNNSNQSVGKPKKKQMLPPHHASGGTCTAFDYLFRRYSISDNTTANTRTSCLRWFCNEYSSIGWYPEADLANMKNAEDPLSRKIAVFRVSHRKE